MNQSQEVKDLFSALSKAQGELRGALKDSSNPFFKSKYADLESIWTACREALVKNGLCVVQTTEFTVEAGVCVVTTLAHSSGQWIRGSLPIMAVKQDPQGMGSAISYTRRYALAAIVGVVQTDDDAETAMHRPKAHPAQPEPSDGHQTASYCVPYGPMAKMPIEKCDPLRLKAYIDEIKNNCSKSGRPLGNWAVELIKHADPLISAWQKSLTKAPMGNGGTVTL